MPRRSEDKAEAQQIATRIGARLRQRREHLKLSQEALSERISITPPAYGRIERGTSLPSFPTLLRLCDELGLRPDELLAESNVASNSSGLRGGSTSRSIGSTTSRSRSWSP